MKKMKNFLIFSILFLAFTSCQKEISDDFLAPSTNNNNNNTTDSVFKVRSYTESFTSVLTGNISATFNLTYDSQDRIVRLVDASDSSNQFVYNYPSANLYTMEQFGGGVLGIHADFYLNTIPSVDSTFQYNDSNDSTTEKYTYDGAGNLIQLKEYSYTGTGGLQLSGQVDYTYDANRNITQERENTGTVTTYEYSTELNSIYVGLKYLPENKNLTSKTTIVDGTDSVVINHTYTFDSSHRVTKETQEYSTGELVEKSYSY